MAAASARGLIHRDMKPASIYLCRYGRATDFGKVLDCGLVKSWRQPDPTEVAATKGGVITGTPSCMAPEQIAGDRPLDARTDIYGVGCVAYWLLTGQQVFEGTSAMRVMTHHLETPPTAPAARFRRVWTPSFLRASRRIPTTARRPRTGSLSDWCRAGRDSRGRQSTRMPGGANTPRLRAERPGQASSGSSCRRSQSRGLAERARDMPRPARRKCVVDPPREAPSRPHCLTMSPVTVPDSSNPCDGMMTSNVSMLPSVPLSQAFTVYVTVLGTPLSTSTPWASNSAP